MKTVLVVLVAVILAAALSWVLICRAMPCPSPGPASVKTAPTCEGFLGPGPREAVVLVVWDTHDGACKLKTVPNKLDTCLKDRINWDTAYVRECADYSGDLTIEVKNAANRGDLKVDPVGPGQVKGEVTKLPTGCVAGRNCSIPYSVTLGYKDASQPPLVEDPRIDIW
jgi:hypothetical protein